MVSVCDQDVARSILTHYFMNAGFTLGIIVSNVKRVKQIFGKNYELSKKYTVTIIINLVVKLHIQ